jgi:radical SAM superfamily enzyme YgiQ (UPF0313 family)
VVVKLLQAGASMQTRTPEGLNAVQLALETGDQKIIQLLQRKDMTRHVISLVRG